MPRSAHHPRSAVPKVEPKRPKREVVKRELKHDVVEPEPLDIYRRSYADIQKVPFSNTAVEQRNLFLKQVSSVGAMPWLKTSHALSDAATGSHLHIEVWIFCTDAGGDQRGCDTKLDFDVRGRARQWKIRSWCIHHQAHLIVERQVCSNSKPTMTPHTRRPILFVLFG